ncbi:MAG: M14 family metallopeptidase [Acidimicrobiales bacterium]|nr:M14 family metallopeptidase [Actinomycetota bacterium]
MTVILRVTSPDGALALTQLVTAPLGLDVWETGAEHLVLRASEAQAERLEQMGFGVEQLDSTESYLSRFAVTDLTQEVVAGYHSAETLENDLRSLAEAHPEIAELREIGRSLENRPIWALRIGDRRGSTRKALFTGCHHAREWIAVEVPYLLAAHLVTNANRNPIKTWLTQGEIWVTPMVNPDGHEFSRTQDRLWRKNRRRNPDGSIGVDPNRNYGYMWGVLNINTSSHVPSDETYVGPRAFSEPETRAVRDLVAQQLFQGVISYHSYSQLVLYPWGYTSTPVRDLQDRQRMSSLATRMQRAIRGVHGVSYTAQQSSKLYPTAGDTTDWTYGEYGILSFTIELRPASHVLGGFVLPPDQIQPTWEENRPAALEFLKEVFA